MALCLHQALIYNVVKDAVSPDHNQAVPPLSCSSNASQSVPGSGPGPAFAVPPVMNYGQSEPMLYVPPPPQQAPYHAMKPPPDLPFPEHPKPSMKSMSNKFRQSMWCVLLWTEWVLECLHVVDLRGTE